MSLASVLIVNPHASRVTPERAAAVARELARAGALEVLETTGPGHAREIATAVSGRADRIYVYSGDGTFNEALNGLVADVPIGFLPGGGTSVLPRALGLPRDPVASARLLAHHARTRRIALGRVNGRRFAFSAGLGFDAAAVRMVDQRGRTREGRRAGDLAFVAAFARLLRDAHGRIDPQIDVAGHGRVAWALVCNGDPYSYAGRLPIHVGSRACFESGLDLVAPRAVRIAMLPRLLRYALRGRGQDRAGDVLYLHDADRIELHADGPLPLQTDGEDLGDTDHAVCEAERDAVSVLVAPARNRNAKSQ